MTTPNEMRAGERTLSRAAGLVADAKADLLRLNTTLTDALAAEQARWQGQGGRAFTNLQQAWTQKQTRIVNALNEFEAALTSTEQLNVNTDQAQSDALSVNTSRLDGVPNY